MTVFPILAHVVYRTRRFEEMIGWYQTVFNARIQFESDRLAFLTYDVEHHRFAFVNLGALDPSKKDVETSKGIGVDHVAYTYENVGDLLEQFSRLRDGGINPVLPVHHGITLSLYYRDPDGNGIEFQVDCFDTKEKSNGYITGKTFAANPMGARFDPEELLDRFRRGESSAALLAMPASD